MSDNIDTRRMAVETINRSLDHHVSLGTIQFWCCRRDGGWDIMLSGTGPYKYVAARTKREVGILLAGLISAESVNRAGQRV
jgi:hypothetical protein